MAGGCHHRRVSLPFGIWLSRWNLPIWVSFIVWAEYFALGAKGRP